MAQKVYVIIAENDDNASTVLTDAYGTKERAEAVAEALQVKHDATERADRIARNQPPDGWYSHKSCYYYVEEITVND